MQTEIPDLTDELWAWIVMDHSKSHACPKHLVSKLIGEMTSRGATLSEVKATTNITFDLPGMMWLGWTSFSVKVDTLEVEIPSHDWVTVLGILKNLKERKFQDGTSYFKLHGYLRCIVLTPAQRDKMIEGMEQLAEKAELQAARDLQNS